MSELRFVPPAVEFDPRLTNELARREGAIPAAVGMPAPAVARRSPFEHYRRTLTDGGILIEYRDLNLGWLCRCLRFICGAAVTFVGAWLIFFVYDLSALQMAGGVALVGLLDFVIFKYKIKARHSVEIRPDCMIVDGTDIFWAEDIGDNWPELQMKDDDPDRMVISGICGTRYVEYMSANRIHHDTDRMPEVLAAHLTEAMEQLWGRREVTFPSAR